MIPEELRTRFPGIPLEVNVYGGVPPLALITAL